jgi:hypothetical protein
MEERPSWRKSSKRTYPLHRKTTIIEEQPVHGGTTKMEKNPFNDNTTIIEEVTW